MENYEMQSKVIYQSRCSHRLGFETYHQRRREK